MILTLARVLNRGRLDRAGSKKASFNRQKFGSVRCRACPPAYLVCYISGTAPPEHYLPGWLSSDLSKIRAPETFFAPPSLLLFCVPIIRLFDYYYYDFLLTVGFCSVRQRDPEATPDPSFSYCLVTAWPCVPPLACSSAYELLRVLKLLPDTGSVVPYLISSLFPDAGIALRLDTRSGNLQLANFESSPRPRKKIASYEGAWKKKVPRQRNKEQKVT